MEEEREEERAKDSALAMAETAEGTTMTEKVQGGGEEREEEGHFHLYSNTNFVSQRIGWEFEPNSGSIGEYSV